MSEEISVPQAHQAFISGDLDRAHRLLTALLSADPENFAALQLMALTRAARQQWPEALELFERLRRLAPGDANLAVNHGCALMDSGDLAAAIQTLEAAVELAPISAQAHHNLAIALYREQRYHQAATHFQHALHAQPELTEAAALRARCLAELGDARETRSVLGQIATMPEPNADEWNHIGLACLRIDELEFAKRAFARALSHDQAHSAARINRADLFEQQNQLEQARAELDAVPQAARGELLFILIDSRLRRRAGDLAGAALALDQAELDAAHPRLVSQFKFERGRVLDGLGEYAQAYRQFSEANALARGYWRKLNPGLDAGVMERLTRQRVSREQARDWSRVTTPTEQPAPVFIVGFPRSGTTLLDQTLDAHPQIQVLNEQPAVESMARLLAHNGIESYDQFDQLTAQQLNDLQLSYWNTVNQCLERETGTVLVDKYPFNMLRLPLIKRVFPDARFILCLRHPADVCLSCFMQDFRINQGTVGFWSLADAATLYAQAFEFWDDQAAILKPQLHCLYYEKFVAEHSGQTQQILDFLGLPWHDAVSDYAAHARSRGRIGTPSYARVTEAISNRAVGRWANYQDFFAAAMPDLQTYIDRYPKLS